MAMLGYARVSTRDQDPTRQVHELTAAGCERIWTDHGVSGTKASRPELDRLIAYARPGDVVTVTELSRLGRGMRALVIQLDDWAQAGIFFRSLTQGIDTSTSTGTLLLGLFSALSEMERAILVERVNSGLASSRRAGRVGGRPVAVDAERLVAARALIDSGQSVVSVARTLGVGRSSLYRALERERAAVGSH